MKQKRKKDKYIIHANTQVHARSCMFMNVHTCTHYTYTNTQRERNRDKFHFTPSDVPNEQETYKIGYKEKFNRHLSIKTGTGSGSI